MIQQVFWMALKVLSIIFSLSWLNFLIFLAIKLFFLNLMLFGLVLKGALDKYNNYPFVSSSIEDLKSNHYRKFQLIPPMRFHFMRYFVNNIIFRVPHRLLYYVFIEVDFEK